MIMLAGKIRCIVSRIILSMDSPEAVARTLKEFKDIFEDDSNFIESEKWGTTEGGKEIVPFSFSKKGLGKIQNLMANSKQWHHIYSVGTAGIKGEMLSLIYFLTQYFSSIGMVYDYIKLHPDIDISKFEPIKNVNQKMNARHIYDAIAPFKKYTPEEAKIAKNKVLSLIEGFIKDFQSIGPLTKEEEKLFSVNN
jgi:hypothetical protein